MIDWSLHFNRAVCFCHRKNGSDVRHRSIEAEFKRVGLLDSGIFRWSFTYANPWEKKLIEAYPKIWRAGANKTAIGFLNLGFASMRALREAIMDGCGRVLFLEDDIRFLKDPGEIVAALDDIPDGFDIVQFDKFVKGGLTADGYRAMVEADRINAHYFDAKGRPFMSSGCFLATRRGMENMLRAFEEWRPGPMDGYLNMNGNTHAVAIRNLAVQVVLTDAMVLGYAKPDPSLVNTHHAAYAPQGVRYEDYAVPDGYGYGRLTARVDG